MSGLHTDPSVVLDPCVDAACPTCCHPRIVAAAERAIDAVRLENSEEVTQRALRRLDKEPHR